MLCFRDRTFCPFYKTCKHGIGCDRALTIEVIEQATLWWGKEGAPISQFMEEPSCWEKQ